MASQMLLLALCFSVALNAVLLGSKLGSAAHSRVQQASETQEGFMDRITNRFLLADNELKLNKTAKEKFEKSHVSRHLSADDVSEAGSVFFYEQLAKIVSNDNVLRSYGSMEAKERPVGKPGLDLLSVRLSEEELESKQLSQDTIETLIERLDKHGVFVLPEIINQELCRRLAELTHQQIQDPDENFGLISRAEWRKDHPLKLQGDVLNAMQTVLQLLKPVLEGALGPQPQLRELSTLTAYPGSAAQQFHPDTLMKRPGEKVTKLFSSFLYLDHIGMDQAALDVFPGTHRHAYFLGTKNQLWLDKHAPFLRVAVPQGSLVMYDSRIRHRGSANLSPLVRPTLYFSVQENSKEEADGSTYSIYDDYEDLTIDDVLANRIPELPRFFNLDDLCFRNMKAKCPGLDHEDLFKCSVLAPGLVAQEGDAFWPEDISGFDLPDRCILISRIEKLSKAHVFHPTFKAQASWGPLPNRTQP